MKPKTAMVIICIVVAIFIFIHSCIQNEEARHRAKVEWIRNF